MKITKTEKEIVIKEVIQDVLCNKCTKSLRTHIATAEDDGQKIYETYGIVEQTYNGGYCSDPLEDEAKYTFSLCESCLKELFDSFKIPVEKKWSMPGVLQSRDQQKINEIYKIKSKAKLANYLLDENTRVREYAKIRAKELKK